MKHLTLLVAFAIILSVFQSPATYAATNGVDTNCNINRDWPTWMDEAFTDMSSVADSWIFGRLENGNYWMFSDTNSRIEWNYTKQDDIYTNNAAFHAADNLGRWQVYDATTHEIITEYERSTQHISQTDCAQYSHNIDIASGVSSDKPKPLEFNNDNPDLFPYCDGSTTLIQPECTPTDQPEDTSEALTKDDIKPLYEAIGATAAVVVAFFAVGIVLHPFLRRTRHV